MPDTAPNANELPLSLLWPTLNGHYHPQHLKRDTAFTADLSIRPVLEWLCIDPRYNRDIQGILLSLCDDPAALRYRHEVIDDLLRLPDMTERLEVMLLEAISFTTPEHFAQWSENQLQEVMWRISELKVYVDTVTTLHAILNDAGGDLRAPALRALRDMMNLLAESETISALQAELPDLEAQVRRVSSVTIGVNLDAQLRPVEAILLAINAFRFKRPSLLGRFFGHQEDPQEGVGPLHSTANLHSAPGVLHVNLDANNHQLLSPLLKDLSDILSRTSRAIKAELQKYLQVNTSILARLQSELAFYLGMVRLIRHVQACGLPMCRPEIAPTDARVFSLTDLYNLNLALHMSQKLPRDLSGEIVVNDLVCGEEGRIFILTGPNRGGKTTFIHAVGLAQILFQVGCYVPASRARMSIADGIYTHFATEERPDLGTGRLGEEAQRLSAIFARATPNSLVLLNESLTSTSPSESLYLSRDVVQALRVLGARAVFATHLHELAADADAINAEVPGDSKVVSLVATVIPDVSGADQAQRTFRILPGPPVGKSYAREIATRYGISFEQLTEAMRARGAISKS